MFEAAVFYAFGAVLLASGVAVITARNPVHGVLFLVLAFFTAAALWLLLNAEFLAIALVVVYVGAVMVLFLFVVMMLDLDIEPLREGYVRYLPVGLLVAAVMLVEMLALLGVRSHMATGFAANAAEVQGTPNALWLARALFTDYLLPFEVAAVILTIAVIAAVTLTLRHRTGVKTQDPSAQSRVRATDRVRLVKMAPERPLPPAFPEDAP